MSLYISKVAFVQQKYILAKLSFIFQRVTRVVISGLSVRVQGELEDLHEIIQSRETMMYGLKASHFCTISHFKFQLMPEVGS